MTYHWVTSRGQLMSRNCSQIDDEDDFDQLLEASSLRSPVAKAIQALTPDDVHTRVRDQIQARRDSDRDDQGDVDDVLLRLVQRGLAWSECYESRPAWVVWAQSPRYYLVTPRCVDEPRERVIRWTFLPEEDSKTVLHIATHGGPSEVRAFVQLLLDRGVFSFLRKDVARSLVSIGFTRENAAPVYLTACSTAVPASGIAEELEEEFHALMRDSTAEAKLVLGRLRHDAAEPTLPGGPPAIRPSLGRESDADPVSRAAPRWWGGRGGLSHRAGNGGARLWPSEMGVTLTKMVGETLCVLPARVLTALVLLGSVVAVFVAQLR